MERGVGRHGASDITLGLLQPRVRASSCWELLMMREKRSNQRIERANADISLSAFIHQLLGFRRGFASLFFLPLPENPWQAAPSTFLRLPHFSRTERAIKKINPTIVSVKCDSEHEKKGIWKSAARIVPTIFHEIRDDKQFFLRSLCETFQLFVDPPYANDPEGSDVIRKGWIFQHPCTSAL